MGERYEAAAVAIFLSGVLDGLDGRVARLTRSTQPVRGGVDSLSDLVAFGLRRLSLHFSGPWRPLAGWGGSRIHVCGVRSAAACTLQCQKSVEDVNYFKGLPIPAAACFIASLVLS